MFDDRGPALEEIRLHVFLGWFGSCCLRNRSVKRSRKMTFGENAEGHDISRDLGSCNRRGAADECGNQVDKSGLTFRSRWLEGRLPARSTVWVAHFGCRLPGCLRKKDQGQDPAVPRHSPLDRTWTDLPRRLGQNRGCHRQTRPRSDSGSKPGRSFWRGPL